ncbi:hypothetical protein PVAP13_2KG022032 [Panicum virgatum]|uniref:Uncharacterized protein n=1 Tax=Panicum virgatum TaxID=38727 RepID=A0A8T0VU33_PANVG|nr:hypothetical protein PVAP13_2KG022032 [Panicum virgatum]
MAAPPELVEDALTEILLRLPPDSPAPPSSASPGAASSAPPLRPLPPLPSATRLLRGVLLPRPHPSLRPHHGRLPLPPGGVRLPQLLPPRLPPRPPPPQEARGLPLRRLGPCHRSPGGGARARHRLVRRRGALRRARLLRPPRLPRPRPPLPRALCGHRQHGRRRTRVRLLVAASSWFMGHHGFCSRGR